ncbi:hypothetical protein SAMN05421766_10831 [Zobellia uliginosa]|uniref:Uncharacterized protein n=1 Tax=Zobellia uliginosa TaxID=143224 RepID=A0ABY1L0X6_9FLAO|nr:hypothetical protein SAMN05421766_10831 [Zobellia uliginosa]
MSPKNDTRNNTIVNTVIANRMVCDKLMAGMY